MCIRDRIYDGGAIAGVVVARARGVEVVYHFRKPTLGLRAGTVANVRYRAALRSLRRRASFPNEAQYAVPRVVVVGSRVRLASGLVALAAANDAAVLVDAEDVYKRQAYMMAFSASEGRGRSNRRKGERFFLTT